MKKTLLSLFAVMLLALTANAQHEYVDLGLPSGTLWATCNIGANSPEEYGDYFAWGETEPKSDYSWETYKWCKGSIDTMTKYCTNSNYGYNGFTDGITVLLPEDDAATQAWGDEWQMPSIDQLDELYHGYGTTVEWAVLNGVDGLKITGKNGNSIFLPLAGYREDTNLYDAENHGYYWSRTLYFDPYYARNLHIDPIVTYKDEYTRYWGLSVRPVRVINPNPETKTITWDYNTIKGIDFSTEAHYHSGADSYRPIISKDGITWLGFVDAYSRIYLENCNLGTNTSHDYAPTLFFSNIGSISSIVITCDDGEGTIYDEDYNEWTTSQTSVVWTNGGFNTKVNMPLKEKSEIKGITQITFTVEDNDIRSYIAYGFPVSWKVNGEYTDGVYETWAGETLLITPYTNRVITNIKAIDATSYETTYLVNNGNGSWILPSMPAYNVMIMAEYGDENTDPRPEVYTEFVEETGTLTYYYDDKRETRTGVTELYDPVGNPDVARFTGYYKKVKKAVIDPSMKQAPLTSMYSMFFGGINGETFAFQVLSNMTEIKGMDNLNTANVTRMDWMFEACNSLQTIDVSSFDVSKVTKMDYMFGDCYKLTTIYCNDDWSNTSASSFYMFATCTSLVGGKGTTFDSEVKDKTYARPDGGTESPGYFTEKPSLQGDLNGDGKVDIADAVTVLNIMAAGEYNASADLNGDGKDDIADFVTILNIMAAQ